MWQKGNNSTHKAKNQTVKTLFFVRTDTHACTHSNYAAQIYDTASYWWIMSSQMIYFNLYLITFKKWTCMQTRSACCSGDTKITNYVFYCCAFCLFFPNIRVKQSLLSKQQFLTIVDVFFCVCCCFLVCVFYCFILSLRITLSCGYWIAVITVLFCSVFLWRGSCQELWFYEGIWAADTVTMTERINWLTNSGCMGISANSNS